MEIRNLREIALDTIFCAFERAFSDYEIRFEKEEVFSMLKRRGFNPALSFAAFDGEDIVAFTLNGTGEYNGVPTAYDTGTGTVKEYRGKGIAKDIFIHSIPYLKEAGIGQYLLEVLQNNAKAISVYRKLGFGITREFDCFRQKRELLVDRVRTEQGLPVEIAPIEVAANVVTPDFYDFHPSWQNSKDSIRRAGDDLIGLGAFVPSGLIGYCVFDPLSGDLSQIAVDKAYRRKGVASLLLQEVVRRGTSDIVKVLNVVPSCRSLSAFMESKNIRMASRQFEMIATL